MKKGNWTTTALLNAVRAVKNGESRRKSALRFGVPRETLQRRLNTENYSASKQGRKPTFSKADEDRIVAHLVRLANAYHGLTPAKLRKLVYELAVKLKIPHPFCNKKKSAGKHWYYLFIKRHPEISLRKPEGTSINRIQGFNANEVDKFYSNVATVTKAIKFEPPNIWNMDETGVTTVQV